MKLRHSVLALLIVCCLSTSCQTGHPVAQVPQPTPPPKPAVQPATPAAAGPETASQRAERMRWFQDARFGMFIHWGLYSIPGGVYSNQTHHAEWYVETTHMPMSQYEKFADRFNPVKFDAKLWAQIAADAGMKYICITSMHHDGFAMFPSAVSNRDNWSLSRTPFGQAGRDPLMELKKACEKRGIKFCLYHTIMDWHSPLYGGRRGYNDVAAQSGIQPDMDKFQAYLEDSVKEVIARYQPAMLWFDGNWEGCWTLERGKHLEAAIRAVDRNVIINNRIGKGDHATYTADMLGDYLTPEQKIPGRGYGRDVAFESCMTMSGHNYWGYNKADADQKSVKSTQTLLTFLFDLAAKGGNMLLNVGPTPEGEIPPFYVDALREMGAWLKVNGEAIYGTRAGIYGRQPAWGRTTTRQLDNGLTRVYAILFEAPKDGILTLAGLKNTPKQALLLDGRSKVAASVDKDGLVVKLPASVQGKRNFVVAVDVRGEIDYDAVMDLMPKPDEKGVITLLPHHAELKSGIVVQGEGDSENLGYWTKKEGTATWTFAVPAAQSYQLTLQWGAPQESAGSIIELAVRGAQEKEARVLPFEIKPTGAWDQIQTADLGAIALPAGQVSITARARTVNGIAPCNLGTLKLTPAK